MDSIQSNRVFGDFIIKQKIGSGGMASVFQAAHSVTNEEVALKILHEHYADDPHIRKRLEHEARIVMRLSHPTIVPVLGYGEFDKRPYLIMPYMEGGSLAQFFSKPRLVKHETTLKLLTLLADGLDYAHSQEVVHRDLKLENILLSKKNVLAISDFGIAQSTHTTRITMTGQILGTPQYLAPENLDNNGQLNYRADLYALGVMAYLMLTGYFPFTAKDPLSIAIKHRTEIAPTPSLVNQNLPMAIDPVFVKALAKKPDDRFSSAHEFIEVLDDAFAQAATVTTTIFINEANPVPPTQAAMQQADLLADDSRITKVLPPVEAEPIPVLRMDETPRLVKDKSPRALLVALFLLFLCAGSSLTIYAFNGGIFAAGSFGENAVQAESSAEVTESLFTDTAEPTLEASEESSDIETTGFGSIGEDEEATSTPTAIASRTPRPTNTPRVNSTATARGNNNAEPTDTSTVRPTNTARPSSTPTTRPINTARPSNTPQPAATNTPRPLPTNTPRPLPTNTPQPQPTAVPPTNVPPTNVPPTNPPAPTAVPPTSVPPTNAPAPTNPPPQPTTILDPILEPVNTLLPCIPIPLVKTCP